MREEVRKAGVRIQNPESRMIRLRTAFIDFLFFPFFWILTPGFWILFFFIPHPSALIPSCLPSF
jgi:hypothetical protein